MNVPLFVTDTAPLGVTGWAGVKVRASPSGSVALIRPVTTPVAGSGAPTVGAAATGAVLTGSVGPGSVGPGLAGPGSTGSTGVWVPTMRTVTMAVTVSG